MAAEAGAGFTECAAIAPNGGEGPPATAITGLRAKRSAPSANTTTKPPINGHFNTSSRPGICCTLPGAAPPAASCTCPLLSPAPACRGGAVPETFIAITVFGSQPSRPYTFIPCSCPPASSPSPLICIVGGATTSSLAVGYTVGTFTVAALPGYGTWYE